MNGVLFSVHSLSFAPDDLLLLLAALVLDAAITVRLRPRRAALDPARWLESATVFLERRLNRPDRSLTKRLFRGTVVLVVLLAGASAVGWAFALVSPHVPFGWIPMLLVLTALVIQRRPIEEAGRIGRALRLEGLAAGQREAASVLGPPAAALDAPALSRHTTAFLGERLAAGLVGSVFWFALLGLPGLFAYRAARVAGRLLPEDSAQFGAFGMAATRFQGVVSLFPAILAGLLIAAAAAFTPGASPARAFAVMLTDREKHHPPPLGWPVGAMSGALGLALAVPDPARIAAGGGGTVVTWIGEGAGGRMDARPADISRALYLYGVTALLTFGLAHCWSWPDS